MKKTLALVITASLLLIGLAILTGCGSVDYSDHQLVGMWTGDAFRTFRPDGTGYTMHAYGTINFTWRIGDNNALTIRNRERHQDFERREEWRYSISSDLLTLTNSQNNTTIRGFRFTEEPLQSHAILGTWLWSNNNVWTYHFREDGTGTRGYHDNITEFFWRISDNVLHIHDPNAMLEVTNELWAVTIDRHSLVMQLGSTTYTYTRR